MTFVISSDFLVYLLYCTPGFIHIHWLTDELQPPLGTSYKKCVFFWVRVYVYRTKV